MRSVPVGWVEAMRTKNALLPKPIMVSGRKLMGFGNARKERALPLPILRARFCAKLMSRQIQ